MRSKITKSDVKEVDIQKLIDTLYQNAVTELDLNEDEKNLLEQKLITAEGYRLPVYLNIAKSNPNVRMEKINGLENKKIIKRYFVDGKPCIEIIHDKYAAAAKKERDFKSLAEMKKMQVIREQEELKKQKADEDRRIAEENARLERKKIEERLILAEERAALERSKAEQERLLLIESAALAQQKADQEQLAIWEKAERKQQKLIEQNEANKEKLAFKSKAQRWLVAAGIVALILAIFAFVNYFIAKQQTSIAKKQTNVAIQQSILTMRKADSLTLERNNVLHLYSSLRDTTERLIITQFKLAKFSDSLAAQNRIQVSLRKQVEENYNEAVKLATIAEQARAQAVTLNTYLKKREEELSYQIDKNNVAKRLGQLLSSAKDLQFTSPAAAYATISYAVSLDSTDTQISGFYDVLNSRTGYFESALADGILSSTTPDGNLILIRPLGIVEVIDLKGNVLSTFIDKGEIKAAQVLKNGKKLLVLSTTGVSLWNLASKKLIVKVPSPSNTFDAFFEVTSDHFGTISGGRADIWETDGTKLMSLPVVEKSSEIFSVFADTSSLVVNSDKGISSYRLGRGYNLLNQFINGNRKFYFLIPNQKNFISIYNKVINLYDNRGKVNDEIEISGPVPVYDQVGSVIFSPDGSRALMILGTTDNRQLQVQQKNAPAIPIFTPTSNVMVDFKKKTAKVIEHKIFITDSTTREELKLIIDNAAFSADGQQLLATFSNRELRNNLHTYRISSSMDLLFHGSASGKYPFSAFNFSPDGRYIVTSSEDYKTKIWIRGVADELSEMKKLVKFSREEIYRLAGIKD